MAYGIVMGLASKKSALFSQYRRAAEIPVLVSQYSVTLSRMSSRVRALCSCPLRAFSTSPGWPVPSPWSSMNAARSTGESASPYRVCGRVAMICAYGTRVIAKRVGPRWTLAPGIAIAGFALVGLSQLGVSSSYAADVLPALVLFGAGVGLTVSC